MQNVFEIETEEELEEFTKCLEQCRDCDCLVTIYQVLQHKDERVSTVVEQITVNTNNLINISGDYVYLTLMSADNINLQRIKSMFRTVLERNTTRFTNGKAGDYELTFDLIKQDEMEYMAYRISFIMPAFLTDDSGKLTVMFKKDCVVYSEDSIDYSAVQDEIDYLDEIDRIESEKNDGVTSEEETNDDFEETETPDVLSNDEYIYGVNEK
jgi:hypothetical protein